MVLIVLRTIIVFGALLILMRLMGKRQIGEMQPYELVVTLIIAEIACVPMSDPTIPLSYGLASILAVYLLHQVVSLIDLLFPKMKKVISGTPSIVINKDGIDESQLQKNNLDIGDLIESMRGAGYFSLETSITRCTRQTAPFPPCQSRRRKKTRKARPCPSF